MTHDSENPPPDGIYDVTLLYGDVIRNCRVRSGYVLIPLKDVHGGTKIIKAAMGGAYKLTPVVIPDFYVE